MRSLLVFGSVNLDASVRVERLPAPGETLLGGEVLISPGGKGANQAHAAARWGADVALVGAVGRDALAEPALALLREAGVALDGVARLADAATGLATIHVLPSGENAIVVAPGANARVAEAPLDEGLVAGRDLLLQAEVPMAASMAAAARVKAAGGRVFLNLAPLREAGRVRPELIDWLIVNRGELEGLRAALEAPGAGPDGAARPIAAPGTTGTTGTAAGIAEAAAAAGAVARHWAVDVVVTCGADGAIAVLKDGRRVHVPALAIDAVDTTGAGDTFCGVFAAALAAGRAVEPALRHATVAAGLACCRPGAQAAQPARREIEAALAAAPSARAAPGADHGWQTMGGRP